MKTRLFSAVFLMWIVPISPSGTSDHRLSKRSFYLLFPRNSVFQFTYGLTVPYVLPRRSINLTWGFQAQYNYPYNISNFFPKTIAVRSGTIGFDLQKITFYDYLAKTLDNFGLHGEQCVLRSVCEVAEIPMYDKEGSVLEKIMEYLFTPSFEMTTNETKRALDNQNNDLWSKLLRAEKRGKIEDIQWFYKGGTVFLTGATSFIGKLILEKILRALPVRKVFILVREKENEPPSQRVHQIFESPIFDGLKRSNPEAINKVVTLEGDCVLPMLGLRQENVETIIKEVDVILHCAAAVRFDEQLKNAVKVNVEATRDLVEIAKKIKKLKTFVYVGTAFSNFNTSEIKEEIYPCKIEAQKLIAACESLDNDTVNSIAKTLVADWPNAYTFTKQVSEDWLKRQALNMPICIVRPTIVISTHTEPVNAFVDNEFSLAGLVMANSLGTCRINYYKNSVLDIVPADYAVNAFIAAGWYTGDNFRKHRGDIQIYNISSSQDNPITQDEIWSMVNYYTKFIPSPHMARFPCYFRTTCEHNYLVTRFFFHTLVAMIADYILSLQGKKPMYVDQTRKLHDIQDACKPFFTTEFFIHVGNTHKLLKRMSFKDRELFNFDMGTINWDSYFAQYVKGLRIYLLKDPMKTIPEGKKRFAYLKKVFIVLSLVVTILLYAAGKILLFRVLPFILWIVSSTLQDLVCQ